MPVGTSCQLAFVGPHLNKKLSPKMNKVLAWKKIHFLGVNFFPLTLNAGFARGTYPNRRGEVVLSNPTMKSKHGAVVGPPLKFVLKK